MVLNYSTIKVKFVIHEGEVIALFPDLVWSHIINDVRCFSFDGNVGKHGGATRKSLKCKRAKPHEYYELYKALRAIYENPSDGEITILKII